jgi:tetratricopeptide (TPR) repeat protein
MMEGIRFFVSFSSHDLKYVREIMSALKGQGIDFWNYADLIQGIELGEKIDDRLMSEINDCTHLLVIISRNSMDPQIGRFCRFELQYANSRKSRNEMHFIPVLINLPGNLKLEPPYDVFEVDYCQEVDDTPESIVKFTVKVCKLIGKQYIPPIEAHQNLPFWKLFRKEVEDIAHSNKEHVDLMMILGEFNEYYLKADMQKALFLITYFLQSCAYKVPSYQPFYPVIVKAVCETELGKYDDAMNSYKEAKRIHPYNQDVIGGIGTVFFKTGHYQMAAGCFEEIIRNEKNEDVTNARINLIISKLAMGQAISGEDAVFLFKVDISAYSIDLKTAILNARGICLITDKDYPFLESLCKKIIQDNMHDTITIRLLQISFLNRGLVKEAKEVIRSAIKEAEGNSRLDKDALSSYWEDCF